MGTVRRLVGATCLIALVAATVVAFGATGSDGRERSSTRGTAGAAAGPGATGTPSASTQVSGTGVWRAGPDPAGIVNGRNAVLLRAREVPGGGRFRVEEWVRCRQPDYSVPACPLRDVVAAYEFTDRFDNRLLVNRGSHDEVGYLGEGEWLITGYRDAAVLTARSDAPKRLTVRSDIVVMPEPDMVHAPCPDSVWRTADGWTAEGRTEPAACLVDESTWQLIRIVAPQVDVWHESPSQPLWGTRRSTQTGAHEAVVMQDDGTWGVSRIAASDRLVWPIANLPFGVLAVYRTGPGGTDPRELVVSTDGGLSWRVRHVPVDRLALLGENTRAELVLPEEWTTWTVVAPCHAVAPSVMAVRCNQTVG